MKNIHILPTDKPSRLIFDKEDNIYLSLQDEPVFMEHQNLVENQNIYITSDEEIKEGSIVLSTYDKWGEGIKIKPVTGKIIKIEEDSYLIQYYSKHFGETQSEWDKGHSKIVSLTTDIELIEDGVQTIPDEFLEWFVKNPNVEKVGIQEDSFFGYRPIILKQETLEEAAEKFRSNNPGTMQGGNNTKILNAFKNGAKWQAERMYSEEEVLTLLINFYNDRTFLKKNVAIQWFEQFKKKTNE